MSTATAVLFAWRNEYSVHIPQIDNQHKGLIRLINDLHSAMVEGRGQAAAATILDSLVRYTESHFSFEEGMLRQRGFSRLESHRAEHRRLTQQVQDLREKSRSGRLIITVEVMHFLKNWLANHIMGFDQTYARELAAKH